MSVDNEKVSVSDISIITEQRVFKPGFTKNQKISSHDDPIISFRSRKEHVNMSNVEILEKQNYILDSTIITNEICNKISTTKIKNNEINSDESLVIKKVFSTSKEYCLEKEVLLSPKVEHGDNVILEVDESGYADEYDDNMFCNIRRNLDESTDSKKRSNSAYCNKKSSKRNVGNIVATFSKIDQGNGLFVTEDDFIFILPVLTFPKNINVGSSYTFTISEHNKYQNRLSSIHETIQKKYIKQIK
jgi:hypothetical protein